MRAIPPGRDACLVVDPDRPFVKDGANKRTEDLVRQLIEAGFPLVEDSTLRLFWRGARLAGRSGSEQLLLLSLGANPRGATAG
jgi:hypothetical protein